MKSPGGWYTGYDLAVHPSLVARHRNGVGGAPFYVILFDWQNDVSGERGQDFQAIVFDAPWHTAVLDPQKIIEGNIDNFGSNCWRGDTFEEHLRAIISDYAAERYGEDD